jgi:hypothetical protein
MPRRPREVQLLIESSNHPVSEHLKKEFWRMKEELNESLGECPVCTDPFKCRKCTLLLSCSHLICATCYVKLREPHRCPVCRQ